MYQRERCDEVKVKHYQKYLQSTAALCQNKRVLDTSSHTLCASTITYHYYEDIFKKGGIFQYYLFIGNGRYNIH